MTGNTDFNPKPTVDLNGKGILVTGGTGSFGQAFVRRVLESYKPSRLVIFSRDEQKQVAMERQLSSTDHPALRYFIGDVRDEARLRRAMSGIDYVVHAAAIKHVPVAEYNPIETIKTNILGAENVVNVSLDAKVKKVIALSTDKAANPVNLYGATKLCSDKLIVAANNLAGEMGTKFGVVRYGNVLGSNGSIVPVFREMMARKVESLPITDKRMTRFWITLEQGVDFVLQSLGEMVGGEIFVPKIPSMSLTDLVGTIAPGYPTHEVGIRPGEKLHEAMITRDDAINTLEYDNCFIIAPTNIPKNKSVTYRILGKEGARVPDGFEYRSDLNDAWLTPEGLMALIEKAE
ncbi:UDP-N-acetylglucosamine 4,6-dehydratase (inverting) [Hwanghaeella sp.]|uniref:UDP-N-acetylglucosamine 4,6-dehydratase (inverting) n=1 Tax=Hwanghaeella sp. TaxID=2605943 RepID=UPI003CCB9866